MPSERGKDYETPAKSLTSSTTKRVHRDEMTTTQDASVTTLNASTEIASTTSHGDSPHSFNAQYEPILMLDYNESSLLPSPMDDEDSERMWHGDGLVDPIIDAKTSPVHNSCAVAVTSQSTNNKVVHVESAITSSTITK